MVYGVNLSAGTTIHGGRFRVAFLHLGIFHCCLQIFFKLLYYTRIGNLRACDAKVKTIGLLLPVHSPAFGFQVIVYVVNLKVVGPYGGNEQRIAKQF